MPPDTNGTATLGIEMLKQIRPPNVMLIASPLDTYGKTILRAEARDGRLLHENRIAKEKAKDRRDFARDVLKQAPEIMSMKELEELILNLVIPTNSGSAPEPPEDLIEADPSEYDLRRPGQFMTHEVAGFLRHSFFVSDDSDRPPTTAPELVVIDRSGTRRVTPFTGRLNYASQGSKKALLFDHSPEPLEAAQASLEWSLGAKKRWLGGDTPSIADVRDGLAQIIEASIWFPPDRENALSLLLSCYIVLSYIYEVLDVVPYLHVTGPKGSGKTQGVLRLLKKLMFRAILTVSLTPAGIFRTLNTCGATLLVDEFEPRDAGSELFQEISAILNAGHTRGCPVRRHEHVGEIYVARSYDCFGPKVLGGIGMLGDTTASRCIKCPMLRRPPDAPVPVCNIDARNLRDDIQSMVLAHAFELRDRLLGPETWGLANRDLDLYKGVLVIADFLDVDHTLGLAQLLCEYVKLSILEDQDEQSVLEADRILLTTLFKLVLAKKHTETQPKDLLAHAMRCDSNLFASWSPKRVSTTLKRYGLHTKKARAGEKQESLRVYRDVTEDQLRSVMGTYLVDIPEVSKTADRSGE